MLRKFYNIVAGICIMVLCSCGSEVTYVSGETESVVIEKENSDVDDTIDSQVDVQVPTENMDYVDEETEIAVYVCGAVVNPGVYYVETGTIKQKALEAAGGFDSGAATEYVNLAEEITVGEKIYFPYEDELSDYSPLTDSDITTESGSKTDDLKKVNLNTATKEELMTLSGIGESRAEAIMSYREEQGGFTDIQEIRKVSGIGESIYNNIKDCITVN